MSDSITMREALLQDIAQLKRERDEARQKQAVAEADRDAARKEAEQSVQRFNLMEEFRAERDAALAAFREVRFITYQPDIVRKFIDYALEAAK